ncbi:MAG: ABC transporter permease [Massilia sp.]
MIAVIKALVLNEVRLRMRRTATLVTLLAVVAISWLMIVDPAGGSALIVVGDARVLYTSSALAVGSATLGAMLFGLGGFYLVRGRIAEDVRSGTGSVIASTPVGNALFVVSRWLGGVVYLGALVLAFMLTIMVLQLVRGDGPIEPLVYLQSFTLLLLPMIVFTVSCATLFDNWALLMGKAGDVLFFFVWVAQLAVVMPMTDATAIGQVPAVAAIDFNGMGAAMLIVTKAVNTNHVALGGGDFKANVAPVTMTNALWGAKLIAMRGVACLIGLLPLLLAIGVFHRFSPDKVKVSTASKRRSPLAWLNQQLSPVARLVAPLFRLAARTPGMPGQVMGDVALTLAINPTALLTLIVASVTALVAPRAALAPIMLSALAFWGILISDISTRDRAAGTTDMTGAVHGGIVNRYLRQYAAALALGLFFTGVVALRWSVDQPFRALVLVAGVASMSALATMFGRCSGTARLFMALFLFWEYVEINAGKLAYFDAVGFSNSANVQSLSAWLVAGAVALAAGYAWNRREA